MRAVRAMKEKGFPLGLKCSWGRHNFRRRKDIAKLARDLGLPLDAPSRVRMVPAVSHRLDEQRSRGKARRRPRS